MEEKNVEIMARNTDEDRKKDSLFAKYNDLLTRYPFFVNAIQSGIITAIGVLVSQWVGAKDGVVQWDLREVSTMVFINVVWITPVLLRFFEFLNKLPRGAIDKLVIDQAIFSPPFTASIIALRYLLFDHGQLSDVPNFLIKVLPGVQITAWMFWIPTRFLIINYVPASLALLVNNLAALVWNVIFAMMLK